MVPVFHKFNYYALAICILSPKEITSETAFKKMGIRESHTSLKTTYNQKIFDKDLENIKKMYFEESKTLKEIGLVYKCDCMTISNFLKKHNLQTRKRGNSTKALKNNL